MGPSGSGKSSLFSWMIGALSPQFQASGELWLNEQRVDTLPTAQRQIGILFQDALLFDNFSVGQNLLLALPASVQGPARRHEVESAPHARAWQDFIHAIRLRSPAGNARVSPCFARCWRNPRRCYSMNPLAGWMRRCAIPFSSGSSPKYVNWVFRWSGYPRCAGRSASRSRITDGKLGVNVAICCVNARFLLNWRHRMSSSFSTSGYSMKRVSQMTALALALGLACASSGLLKQHRRSPSTSYSKSKARRSIPVRALFTTAGRNRLMVLQDTSLPH